MDGWQKAPKPPWYDESGGFLWDQLVGQFLNPALGATNRTDNMDGQQAAWLFAVPGLAIFQDSISLAGTNGTPAREFDARYEVGKSYVLTVGVMGGGGGMSSGATLELGLYYVNAAGNRVIVATTTITNTPEVFPPNRKHFSDFTVRVPTVTGREPWAGQPIGVQIVSTVGFDRMGGFWDLDNVRLRAVADPVLEDFKFAQGRSQFTLRGAPGIYEVLTGTNIMLPTTQWDTLCTLTNFTGSVPVTDANTGAAARFYRARPFP